jgi:tripartite-type tricarboxylate transporter receptor subunit TctC
MRRFTALALSLAGLMLGMPPAIHAQAYPTKPIRLVVPFPPGGSTDVIARLLSTPLAAKLQQPVVVDNKPGAGTLLGADLVAKSSPDGYTLLLSGSSTFTVNPVIYRKMPYDPSTALEPIAIVGATALVLLTNPSLRATTLQDAVAEVKARPAGASYGSFGTGTSSHFVGEMLVSATGMNLVHVPYKGSGPAMSDLIGNQIPFSVDTVVAALPQIAAGKVRPLALANETRSGHLPHVPTVAESGYPGVTLSAWFAIVAPKGLPSDVRSTLESALAAVMLEPSTRKALTDNGFEAEYGTPATYRERVAKDMLTLRAVAERLNIKAD